jgi:hypothetical protein
MEQIIEVGFGSRPVRMHASTARERNLVTEGIEDYAAASHAPDYQSAISHVKNTAMGLVSPESHDSLHKIHDALSGGLNVESFERAHSIISDMPNRKDRFHLRGAYSNSMWNMQQFAHIDKSDPRGDSNDLSHHEVSALHQVGFRPSLGHEVVSHKTGIPYRYNQNQGTLEFTKHSFQPVTSYPARLMSVNREDQNKTDYLDDDLIKQTGPIKGEHLAAVKAYTKFSDTFSKYHIAKSKGQEIERNDDHLSSAYGPLVDEAEKHSPILSDAIKKYGGRNVEPMTVYTGVSRHSVLDPNHPNAKKDANGHLIYHAPAFSSTSINESVAHDFLRDKPHDEFGAVHDVLKVEIPANYPHGAYIAHHSEHRTENEFLLDKGHRFVVDPKPTYIGSRDKLVRTFNAKLIPPTE